MEKTKNSFKHKLGIAIGIILCVICIPIIIINSFIIIQGLVNPNQVPSIGNTSPLVVLTDSMYPTIEGGDLILVDKTNPEGIQQGDIISYFDPASTNESAVVTHRVTKVTNENGQLAFATKGDANTGDDKMNVPANKLVGKYNGSRYAGIGNFCMWMKSVPGIIVCVGIPLILLVGYDIIRRRMYAKKQEKTEQDLRAELDALKKEKANS
ncbi:MAG: signal peptidase I [Coriobacteriia bacterium]|nr:signal peptidase I [Coriobacteriia bacterium]